MSLVTSFGGSMGGRVPPVPVVVVEPPVVPPPPAPPLVVAPPVPDPPLPVVLPAVVLPGVCSELQPWNMDQATTAKTTGIANRAILMASPFSSKVAFCRRRGNGARTKGMRKGKSLAAEKLSYFVQPM